MNDSNEPVAWLYAKNGKRSLQESRQEWNVERGWAETPLYTRPPAADPVGDNTSDLVAALNACPDIMHARIQPISQRETEYVLPASLKFRLIAALTSKGGDNEPA